VCRWVVRGYHGGGIEVMVFWVVTPCSMVVGNQRFGGRTASIFKVEVRGKGDTFSGYISVGEDWIQIAEGRIKCQVLGNIRTFIEQVSDYELVMEDPVQWRGAIRRPSVRSASVHGKAFVFLKEPTQWRLTQRNLE